MKCRWLVSRQKEGLYRICIPPLPDLVIPEWPPRDPHPWLEGETVPATLARDLSTMATIAAVAEGALSPVMRDSLAPALSGLFEAFQRQLPEGLAFDARMTR